MPGSDAGALFDAGPGLDAGSAVDAGAVPDGGGVADSGVQGDAGVAPPDGGFPMTSPVADLGCDAGGIGGGWVLLACAGLARRRRVSGR
jgi:hypothetical protein